MLLRCKCKLRMKSFELTYEQLNLVRQWFNSVQDCNPKYLQDEDYFLAADIHEMLGMKFKHEVITGEPIAYSFDNRHNGVLLVEYEKEDLITIIKELKITNGRGI